MSTTINISIPEPLARIYENATEQEQRKAQWLIELVLSDLFTGKRESLEEVIYDISQRAAERGMTPEILEDILNDDE